MKRIRFTVPETAGDLSGELKNIVSTTSGGRFSRKAESLLQEIVPSKRTYLTSSGSHALEFASAIFDIGVGDEVIMPSYTYYSTANACMNRGASVIFVDIDPTTMAMDASLVESAVTPKTKAILAVHYGGVSSDMGLLLRLCEKYELVLIEDAAQSLGAFYQERALGTIGDAGCISFHSTKNITSGGEGGVLLLGDETKISYADMISQHGTDRLEYLREQKDSYTWHSLGSSYIMNEITCASLYTQLKSFNELQERRKAIWNRYRSRLASLKERGCIDWQRIPQWNTHNSHLFYILCKDLKQRSELQAFLMSSEIESATHYIPLHTTPFGKEHTTFNGDDVYTTATSNRLLRLPMHTQLTDADVERVCDTIGSFYGVYLG